MRVRRRRRRGRRTRRQKVDSTTDGATLHGGRTSALARADGLGPQRITHSRSVLFRVPLLGALDELIPPPPNLMPFLLPY